MTLPLIDGGTVRFNGPLTPRNARRATISLTGWGTMWYSVLYIKSRLRTLTFT